MHCQDRSKYSIGSSTVIRHLTMWCGLPVKKKLLLYSLLNLCRHKFKVVSDTTVDLQHHKLHVSSYLQNTQEARFIIFWASQLKNKMGTFIYPLYAMYCLCCPLLQLSHTVLQRTDVLPLPWNPLGRNSDPDSTPTPASYWVQVIGKMLFRKYYLLY